MRIINKIIFLDFDGTLMDSPLPETGKEIWAQKNGKEYPHLGWWGKEESLCLDTFDIKPIDSVLNKIKNVDGSVLTVLLTNRVPKMEDAIKKVLKHNQIKLDYATFKAGRDNKGQRIAKFLEKFPEATEVDFYDDMGEHFTDAQFLHDTFPNVQFNFYLVSEGGTITKV